MTPKAEKIAIMHINEKLRLNIPWKLDFAEDKQTGYYNIVQDGKHRSVNLLSTGEKNIIAFLYFIEKLEEVREEQNNKTKIIIFDDPMNSNDDMMQYVIITELQSIIKNYGDNYCVVLTHNNHFYLNVKYGFESYVKNNFYHLSNNGASSIFQPVSKSEDDFKKSYEELWEELLFCIIKKGKI